MRIRIKRGDLLDQFNSNKIRKANLQSFHICSRNEHHNVHTSCDYSRDYMGQLIPRQSCFAFTDLFSTRTPHPEQARVFSSSHFLLSSSSRHFATIRSILLLPRLDSIRSLSSDPSGKLRYSWTMADALLNAHGVWGPCHVAEQYRQNENEQLGHRR